MKRWTLRICTFLLLGAIINIAVAWGVWMLPSPSSGTFSMVIPGPAQLQWWQAHAPQDFARTPAEYFDHHYFGRCLTDMSYQEYGDPHLGPMRQVALRRRSGWPMFAFDGATWVDTQQPGMTRQTLFNPPQGWPAAEIGLPYEVIPVGFAVNTLFYAAVLWLLFPARFMLRRRRRIRRGLCPKCAYPVGASDVCTECGVAVRVQPQRGASTSAQGNALGHGHATTPEP